MDHVIKQDIIACMRKRNISEDLVPDNDVFVAVVNIGYGKGQQNPVLLTTFYQPQKASEAKAGEENSGFTIGCLPQGKYEQVVLLNDGV